MKLHNFFLIFTFSFLTMFKGVDAQQAPNLPASNGLGGLLGSLTSPTGGLGGIVGQITGQAPAGSTLPATMGTDDRKEVESSAPSENSPLNAIATPLGVDPTLMDAEPTLPGTVNAMGANSGNAGVSIAPTVNVQLLRSCKQDITANKAVCSVAIQSFCSGRCTRLNCTVPTNYVTCIDVCGEKATMMQPCLDAGKRNPGPAQIMSVPGAFDPSAPPATSNIDTTSSEEADAAASMQGADMSSTMGMNTGATMDPTMMGAMVAAPLAVAGIGAAATGVSAAAKGIGSLFKKKKGK